MADVITRFKLETTQYDSKLRDASKGLAEFTHIASIAGNEFARFANKNTEAARAFGSISTSATNAKDKVKELVYAYNDVAKAYNVLTKEQQQSDYGKALAESMQKLQGRIKEAKQEMLNMGDSSKSTGGILGAFKEKLTVNIDAIKLLNVGLQGAKAALDVAKDAFFNNEKRLDDWGRTVESSESLYKGFLNALNTGDISGYLQNIDNITKAARAAYDALDALNTFNAFNQINVEKTRTGMTESIASYREGTGTREDVKAAGDAYKKELQERKKLEKEAYIEAVGKVAAERGVSKNDLLTALSGTYGSYQQLKNMPMSGTETRFYGTGMFGGGGSYQVAVPNSVQEKLGDALRKLNDTELQSLQALGAQAERTGNEIASVDKQLTRILNGRQGGASGSTGGGGGRGLQQTVYAEGSIAWQEQEVQRLTKAWKDAGDAVRDDYAVQLGYAKQRLAEMTGGFNPNNVRPISDLTGRTPTANLTQGAEITVPAKLEIKSPAEKIKGEISVLQEAMNGAWSTEEIAAYEIRITQLQQKLKEFSGDTVEGGKDSQKAWGAAASAISSVGSALQNIDDPTVKVLSTIAQAIANVALAYGQALAQDKTSKSNIYSFIGAAAAATVSMVSTIASIHSSTGYAEGGIVKGNTYSGDNIPADTFVNAGELILNKSQQGAIASQLQNPGGNLRVTGVLRGEDLLISIDKSARRQGRGELVFWKNQ